MKDLDAIYCAARELPSSDRPDFLAQACAGDDELQKRVKQMLAVSAEAEAFITDLPDDESEDRPPASGSAKNLKLDLADAPDEAVGQTLGRYKLLERVGEGGCGVVYVAEQTEPVRRRVALKVIKLGMGTPSRWWRGSRPSGRRWRWWIIPPSPRCPMREPRDRHQESRKPWRSLRATPMPTSNFAESVCFVSPRWPRKRRPFFSYGGAGGTSRRDDTGSDEGVVERLAEARDYSVDLLDLTKAQVADLVRRYAEALVLLDNHRTKPLSLVNVMRQNVMRGLTFNGKGSCYAARQKPAVRQSHATRRMSLGSVAVS